MAVTPQSVQAELDSAITYLSQTTSSYSQMVKAHGSDWTKWPTSSNWYLALSTIAQARKDVGSLTTLKLTASFSAVEV